MESETKAEQERAEAEEAVRVANEANEKAEHERLEAEAAE